MALLLAVFLFSVSSFATATNSPAINSGFDLNYQNLKDDIYEQPIIMMGAKTPHEKTQDRLQEDSVQNKPGFDSWAPYDFSKFDAYLNTYKDTAAEQNRIKRSPKTRRRGRNGRRRSRQRNTTPASSDDEDGKHGKNGTDDKHEYGDLPTRRKEKKKKVAKPGMDVYTTEDKEFEKNFVEMPKDLYQAHLRPGVIFRIHMSEAITKMQYRNYAEDKDESVIEADVEYLRLTRKVINDEITKFEDLKWLMNWFNNRSELIQEHSCNTRYYAVGIPPTMFTHSEEYMKRMCLFDNVYIDHIPYVIGEDSSLMAAVAPPVLHCDAATCTSVPFIDSVMFDERLSRSNVRSITPCQASCRAHCRNRVDCLQRCSERCRRLD